MRIKSKVFGSIILLGSAVFSLTLVSPGISEHLLSAKADQEYLIDLSNTNNDYNGSGTQAMKTELENNVNFSFVSCSASDNGFVTIANEGYFGNSQQITSIESILPEFSTDSGATLKLRASYDKSTWGEWTELTSKTSFRMASHPYYFEIKAVGGNVYVNNLKINFTCVANPDAENPKADPVFDSKAIVETTDYSGTYLVVCDTKGKTFDGSLTTLDCEGNTSSVTINSDDTIDYSDPLNGKTITIEKQVKKDSFDTTYSIKTASGYFIGQDSYANGLSTSLDSAFANYIEYDSTNNNLYIYGARGSTLAFNNSTTGGNRFRYMKDPTSADILRVTYYKLTGKTGSSGVPNYEAGIVHSDIKTPYLVNEKFADFVDDTGLNVWIKMSDNTQKLIDDSKYSYSVSYNGYDIVPTETFPHAGTYTVTVTYGQLCPLQYNITVNNVTNSIVAYKTNTTYSQGDSIYLADLSVIKWYLVDGTSNEIYYSDFASNDISVQIKNPSGTVVSPSGTFDVGGRWTAHVYLTSNSTIYSNINIDVSLIQVQSISLNKSSTSLYIGQTETLTATILPDDASDKTVTWSTTNSSIASVNNGVITAKSAGSATITARAGNFSATCVVTVSPIAVTGVSISSSTLALYVGDSSTLTATIAPANATNKSVTWSVTSGDSVSVTNDGIVSALKQGISVVQVKTSDGDYTATCTVTVSNVAVSSISLNTNSLSLYQSGDKGSLTASVLPSNATDKTVNWSIDATSVATISSTTGSTIEVTPVAKGSATITAQAGDKSATCSITVSDSVPVWTLVESASDLVINNKYVIAADGNNNYAMSTTQNTNNRSGTVITKNGKTISWTGSEVQQFTLESGTVDNTYAFNDGSGYIYAASSSKNQLKTETTKTANSSWQITFEDGVTTLYAQGTNTHGIMQFNPNNGSPIFSSYYSASETNVCLYTLKYGGTPEDIKVTNISVSPSSNNLEVGGSVTLSASVTPSNATNNTVTWSSSDTDVATVSSAGIVTAVGVGDCTITATAKDGSEIYGYASIHVQAAAVTLSYITISNQQTSYSVGDAFVKPTVTAHYSDESTVNVTSTATFSGFDSNSAGSRTITVSYEENGITKTTTYQITVSSSGPVIIDGDEYQITFRAYGSDNSSALTSSTIWSEISSGSDYITSFNTITKVYQGTSGLKFGSSSNGGTLEFNLAAAISDLEASSIKLDVGQYANVSSTVNVYINNDTEPVLSVDSGTTESGTVSIPANTMIDKIKIVSPTRSYVKGITIYAKPAEPVDPTGISVSPSTLTLTRNETSKLSVSYTPSNTNQNKNVTWSSSNTTVATVSSDGTVTAKANGSATITATGYQGITSTCSVTVKDIAVTGISVSPSTAEVSVGSTKQLTATISPSNATNQAVTWSSSNVNYATVNSSGLVTAVAAGTVTITATSQSDSTKKATSVITITEEAIDKWTILMYVCGADLESENSLATGDFREICSVNGKPEDVNIVIQTGGASSWASTYGISASNNQRYHVENKTLVCDNSKVYNSYTSMGLSSTLADFIGWGMKEYPAEKTGLVLWNHGGGMRGVCYDEKKSDDALNNSELRAGISSGLSKAGSSELEFVGFDACLMAVQDIAEFLSPYANYMIASEESEAGNGWDYDNWVDDLYAKKDTTVILKAICDSFIADNGGTSSNNNDQTLSYLDLNYAEEYLTAWENMTTALTTKLGSTSASTFISWVGNNVKHFADSDYNYFHLFDAKDFINKLSSNSSYNPGSTYTSAVLTAHSHFVKYSTCGRGAGNSYGLCMVFVYTQDRNYSLINTFYTTSMTNFTKWRSFNRTYGDLD